MPLGWLARRGAILPEGGVVQLSSTVGATGDLTVLPKAELPPSAVAALAPSTSPTVVFARWISPRAQELLRARGIGFLDTTGNVEVLLDSPAFYISAQGAARDPQPKPAQRPSLRGPKVWALLRTIVEVEPPYGVRELASTLGLTAGYVSRVLKVLDEEALITRTSRGAVATRDWEPLLRALARTYSVLDANTATTWIATAGPEQFLTDIAGEKTARFVVTGSFGASSVAPVAAPAIAMLYTDDPERLARTGDLLPAEQGANVMLLEPYDPVVFERTWSNKKSRHASIAQIAADCLTGAGRMPAEGDALVEWMRRNPQRWSSPSLRTTVDPIAA
jgi:predicted transcriptional regulator